MTMTTVPTDYERFHPMLVEFAALEAGHLRFATLRAELIVGYLPVVQHLARRYARRGQPVEDLEQIATVGLINALDRFDPARGTDFLTYLVPTANGEIQRYFRDRTWALRVPRRLTDLHGAINLATEALSHELGRAPRTPEIAAYLDVDLGQVVEANHAGQAYRAASLDDVLGESETGEGAVLGCDDEALLRVEDRVALRRVLSELPEREHRILTLRFFAGLTQAQIGDEVGLSQMQVSRLLADSLARLRTALLAPARTSPHR